MNVTSNMKMYILTKNRGKSNLSLNNFVFLRRASIPRTGRILDDAFHSKTFCPVRVEGVIEELLDAAEAVVFVRVAVLHEGDVGLFKGPVKTKKVGKSCQEYLRLV